MKIFLTGATGAVGRGLARGFTSAGHSVVGLTSRTENKALIAADGGTAVVGDVRDGSSWLEHARGADAVVHAAQLTSKRPNKKQAQETADADLKCVELLIEAAKGKPLLYTSGVWVYGAGKDRRSESAATAPFPLIAHKLSAEKMVLSAAQSGDVKGVVIRPATVYQPWGLFENLYLKTMAKGGSAKYPGSGQDLKSWIHVDDLARVYVAAAEKGLSGQVLNAADDEPATTAQVIEAMAEAFGAKKPGSAPAFIIKLVLGSLLSPPLLSDIVCSNDAMKSVLGVQLAYPSYREGVRAVAEQYRGLQQQAA